MFKVTFPNTVIVFDTIIAVHVVGVALFDISVVVNFAVVEVAIC